MPASPAGARAISKPHNEGSSLRVQAPPPPRGLQEPAPDSPPQRVIENLDDEDEVQILRKALQERMRSVLQDVRAAQAWLASQRGIAVDESVLEEYMYRSGYWSE